jgi:uncharacterized protein YaaW (UPF0174 family)
MSDAKKLLSDGLADGIGFIGGALSGHWLGVWLGWEVFAPGYSNSTIGAIVLISVGGGAGLQLARVWRAKQAERDKGES